MLKILVLPVLLCFYSGPVTMTSIEYVRGTDSLNVIVRFEYELFLRDFQQTINDDLDLKALSNLSPFPPDLANNYLNSKIHIYLNKELVIGKLLDMKVNEGDVRFKLFYRLKRRPKNIRIKNSLLTGLFSDVENLTVIRLRNFEAGVKFTQDYDEETFVVKK